MDVNTDKAKQSCVLVFVKYPERGQVKSRLAAEFDENATTELYRCFVEDLLLMLMEKKISISICYTPADALNKFRKWLGTKHRYVPQHGNNLGMRMKNGCLAAFTRGYENVVLIGSDSPDLPGSFIDTAFQNLKENDVVIGPCPDGGYYLIGFSQHSFFPSVFRDIKWGTEDVFSCTLKKLQSRKLKVYVMPLWNDIDTFDDLWDLYLRNKDKDFNTLKTMSLLSKYFK